MGSGNDWLAFEYGILELQREMEAGKCKFEFRTFQQ